MVYAIYMWDSLQVIMAWTQPDPQALPSGRGVATHGAPLPDGNIEAKIKDSTPTWRSVLSTGEVAQAYKYASPPASAVVLDARSF